MDQLQTLDSVAYIIQLAVAPVFLLAGIAGFLTVISNRMARIIDRLRLVQRRISRLQDCDELTISKSELEILKRRVQITNKSIGLCTSAAVSVCLLIITLFTSDFLGLHIGGFIAFLFVMAIFLLIAALLLFLKEVQLATRTMDIAREFSIDS